MGLKNYLIEGVSCTGKTSVCHELRDKGYHALNGDQDLAYQGDPATGKPVKLPDQKNYMDAAKWLHAHHIWDIHKVKSVVANHDERISFFCGGSRNFFQFINLFDGIIVLDIDLTTLKRRLASRPEDEFGGKPHERELILQLHKSRQDIPTNGILIDATLPLQTVVEEILAKCN